NGSDVLGCQNCLKMAGPQSRVAGGGFWSQPQAQYSAGTHKLLKEMMQESKLTNFQQRHLEKSLRSGGSLPTECAPTSSAKKKPAPAPKKESKVLSVRNYKPVLRTKEQMEEMGAFEKPDYSPLPNTRGQDKDRQKERLANIMAFGEDIDPKKKKAMNRPPPPDDDEPAIDRFDELQLEIDERRAFLEDMEKHGQGAKYRPLINTEISQKIREMELIDKKRTAELERLIEEEKKGKQTSS
ncbi:UPF0193 protein EVG1-like, partial [Saccostrea echinata]|uniref:UPF0193 protein EVG1-like n=1 Tax=Saccostrea echinata TaxID=191078 RepID=UPI002A834C82